MKAPNNWPFSMVLPYCLLSTSIALLLISCSKTIDVQHTDYMVTLGHISNEPRMGEQQKTLVDLLSSNLIPYSAGGSRVVEFEVPASKLKLAIALLRTNSLVIDGHFLLYTNCP